MDLNKEVNVFLKIKKKSGGGRVGGSGWRMWTKK